MSDHMIQDVSDTALMVAMYRAIETKRCDALFSDPFAEKLAGERGKKIVEKIPKNFIAGWSISIRTVIIDNLIMQAIAEGIDTILNLGAGLDTRPYRMELPETIRWVEVDFEHIIDYKDKLLEKEKPRCRLERIKTDLENVENRRGLFSKLNRESRKILVLTEGVILYLKPEQVSTLAIEFRGLENFKYWIVDYFSPEAMQERPKGGQFDKARFQFFPEEEWFEFFGKYGWYIRNICYMSGEARKLNRSRSLPFRVKVNILKRIIRDKKFQFGEFQKFAGYAIMQPGK